MERQGSALSDPAAEDDIPPPHPSTTSDSFYRTDEMLRRAAGTEGSARKVKVFLTANKLSYQQISFSCMKCSELGIWKPRVLQLELGLGILRSVRRGTISNEFLISDIRRMTKKDGRRFSLIIDFMNYHPYKVAFFNRTERGLFFNLVRLFNVQGYIADKKLPYDPPPWMPNEIQQEISLSKNDGEKSDKIQSGFMTIVYPYVYQGTLRVHKVWPLPGWAYRKVCICHEKLYVFLSDSIDAKSPELLIPLEEHEVENIGEKRFTVKVSGRVWKFEAETEELRERWVKSIITPNPHMELV